MKYLKARKARETKECNIKKEYAIEKVKCSKILLSNRLSSAFIPDVRLLMCFNELLWSFIPVSPAPVNYNQSYLQREENLSTFSCHVFQMHAGFFQLKYFSL